MYWHCQGQWTRWGCWVYIIMTEGQRGSQLWTSLVILECLPSRHNKIYKWQESIWDWQESSCICNIYSCYSCCDYNYVSYIIVLRFEGPASLLLLVLGLYEVVSVAAGVPAPLLTSLPLHGSPVLLDVPLHRSHAPLLAGLLVHAGPPEPGLKGIWERIQIASSACSSSSRERRWPSESPSTIRIAQELV